MHKDWRVVAELGLGALRIRGADALSFLQGQLSNDTTRLQSGRLQLTGYHTPQGRTIAVLHLTKLADESVLALLPGELAATVLKRLQRYVLRAKVRLSDDSGHWRILGYQGAAPAVPDGALCLPFGRARHLVLLPAAPADSSPAGSQVAPEPEAIAGSRPDWIAGNVAEGLPEVYAVTSEAFVAQMLNLDVTGGIAFDKGCYTGQEIIARAHYRGQVKRRMLRFMSQAPCRLRPGDAGVLADGRALRVVEAVEHAGGQCEFLAVTAPASDTASEVQTGAPGPMPIAAQQLPLPYELPAQG
ncbi:MAG TPA: hypothetical protein VMF03_05615 [Steroidobacteraceae bacterium]|nr:hypothetical protein [Steroidobacteraceae bacterium]